MKKKVVALFLTLVIMTSFALAGCGQQTEGNKSTKQNTEKVLSKHPEIHPKPVEEQKLLHF